jgi:YD repeat-containing protein
VTLTSDLTLASAPANWLNQLTQITTGQGPLTVFGNTNRPSTVSVNGVSAKNLPNNSFSAQIPVNSGQIPISVTARDGDGNVGTQSWTVTIPSGGTTNLSYDANGNTLTDPGHTYTYDRLNRLSTVTWPDGSTLSISYDPLGLRNEEVLKNSSGTVIADNKLLWQGGKIVSDGTNNYWSFGQTTGNSQYYFGTDHLGSLRDVTDANGNLVTEYDYDLWGNRTRIQGTQDFNLASQVIG